MSRMLDEPILTSIVPPLQSGDRLTRAEFERRYEAMPEHLKAELIEGVVYMASPVRINSHAEPHAAMMAWLSTYWVATRGTQLFDNGTVRLDADNEVQPDAGLRIHEISGGQSVLGPDDYLEGAPELVAEIAASSASYDLHNKRHVYRRNGVQEYIVWAMYPNKLHWFRLKEGEYETVEPDAEGLIESSVFPGLILDVPALLEYNMHRVLAAVNRGTATPEHAAFVAELARRAAQG
jgi:Uma2 family endonuclease